MNLDQEKSSDHKILLDLSHQFCVLCGNCQSVFRLYGKNVYKSKILQPSKLDFDVCSPSRMHGRLVWYILILRHSFYQEHPDIWQNHKSWLPTSYLHKFDRTVFILKNVAFYIYITLCSAIQILFTVRWCIDKVWISRKRLQRLNITETCTEYRSSFENIVNTKQ